jgi:AmmeMemoRadiSam system protein B
MQGQRTFVVAAGDMAHVGPAFGGNPVTPGDLLHLHDDDRSLIESISRGDADHFYQNIVRENDRNNVCGTAPIYIALQSLGKCAGNNLAYAACPADVNQTSYVTICGIALV